MKVLIKRADGGVSFSDVASGVDPEIILEEWEVTADSSWLPAELIYPFDSNLKPQTDEFRQAWVHNNSDRIVICCTKAKEIALKKLRTERNKLLEEKDKEAIKLLSQGLDTSSIEVEKQTLRDATEVLKELDTTNKYDCESLLSIIRNERDKL